MALLPVPAHAAGRATGPGLLGYALELDTADLATGVDEGALRGEPAASLAFENGELLGGEISSGVGDGPTLLVNEGTGIEVGICPT
jgi:hypothetical protein